MYEFTDVDITQNKWRNGTGSNRTYGYCCRDWGIWLFIFTKQRRRSWKKTDNFKLHCGTFRKPVQISDLWNSADVRNNQSRTDWCHRRVNVREHMHAFLCERGDNVTGKKRFPSHLSHWTVCQAAQTLAAKRLLQRRISHVAKFFSPPILTRNCNCMCVFFILFILSHTHAHGVVANMNCADGKIGLLKSCRHSIPSTYWQRWTAHSVWI
jgi:hypothetical protein